MIRAVAEYALAYAVMASFGLAAFRALMRSNGRRTW